MRVNYPTMLKHLFCFMMPLAVVHAFPNPQLIGGEYNACKPDDSIKRHCKILTYTDLTDVSKDPPTINDCITTCRKTLQEAGDWKISLHGKDDDHKTIIDSPCAFGAGRQNGQDVDFEMHNQDIIFILDQANLKFGVHHKGKVAAEGTMVCDGKKAKWFIE